MTESATETITVVEIPSLGADGAPIFRADTRRSLAFPFFETFAEGIRLAAEARFIDGKNLCPWCDATGMYLREIGQRVPCGACGGTGDEMTWQGAGADDWRERRDRPPRIPVAPNSRVIETPPELVEISTESAIAAMAVAVALNDPAVTS